MLLLRLFFLIACAVSAVLCHIPSSAAELVLPGARLALYFSEGGGAKAAILRAIEDARLSIRVHSFFLSDAEVASALIAARERGVDVEAVLCRRGQIEALEPQGWRLARAGVPVFLNGRFRAEHNKVMIFDGRVVQTGSYNYRFDADRLDAENVLFVESPQLAAVYLEDYARRKAESVPFDLPVAPGRQRDPEDREEERGTERLGAKESGAAPSGARKDGGADLFRPAGELPEKPLPDGVFEQGGPGHHLSARGLAVEAAFAPGGARKAILRHIRAARHSIIVHSYYLSDLEIAVALADAAARGVRVEALLSAKARDKDAAPFLAGVLAGAGIPVRLDPRHRNAHNKVILYDGRIAQTGSYNLKRNVQRINAENVLFLHSPELTALYEANYRRHLAHSVPFTSR